MSEEDSIYILCEYLCDDYDVIYTNLYVHNSIEAIYDKQSSLLLKRINEYNKLHYDKVDLPGNSTFDELLKAYNNMYGITYISKIFNATNSIGKMMSLDDEKDAYESSGED
jgi:hypothetical protein